MSNDSNNCYPVDETFSRQQFCERTGIADDVVAFWIKQGLVLPLPAAPRSHRRFSYEQLHIATVLNAMRSLGANIGVLRAFADALQSGFRVINENTALDYMKLRAAGALTLSLDRFSKGEAVRVFEYAGKNSGFREAVDEADVIRGWLDAERAQGADSSLAKFAKSLSPFQARALNWAMWLTDPSNLEMDNHQDSQWVAWLDENGEPQIVSPNAFVLWENGGPTAAFYINVPALILRLWPERIEAARERYERRRLQHTYERLAHLEATDPREAERYRRSHGIPEDWTEHGQGDEEEGQMDG